jgi:hypothetical protein
MSEEFIKTHKVTSFILKNGFFTLTQTNINFLQKYLLELNIDDLSIINHLNKIRPQLFGFLTNASRIKILYDDAVSRDYIQKLIMIKDQHMKNIYDYAARYELFEIIPDYYLINNPNIFKNIILSDIIDTKLEDLIAKKSDILLHVDTEYNILCIYLCVYRFELFQKLIKIYKINLEEILSHQNVHNETMIMFLIRIYDKSNSDIESFIYDNININNAFADENGGSVLTYALKLDQNLIDRFCRNLTKLKLILNSVISVTDIIDYVINPSEQNMMTKNIRMNIYQLATCLNSSMLKILLDNESSEKITSILNTPLEDPSYNLLIIALIMTPASVQVILNLPECDDVYISKSNDFIGGFPTIIDFQPASYYYLSQSAKCKNYIKLDIDEHFYGYNYKRLLQPNKFKEISHYVLGTQTLSMNNLDRCTICQSYKANVIFVKCKHRMCICCALKSKSCYCREELTSDDKILI